MDFGHSATGYAAAFNWALVFLRFHSDSDGFRPRNSDGKRPLSRCKVAPETSVRTSSSCIMMDDLKIHNVPEAMWFAIRGKVYDLTNFASQHPGGQAILHVCAGRDITQLFEATHGRAQELILR